MMFARGAATPCPTGAGITLSSTRHAHAVAALAPPATTRLTFAERRSAAAKRPGFSTRCRVSTANPADTAVALSRAGSPAGSPSSAGISNSTGQCHRYQE